VEVSRTRSWLKNKQKTNVFLFFCIYIFFFALYLKKGIGSGTVSKVSVWHRNRINLNDTQPYSYHGVVGTDVPPLLSSITVWGAQRGGRPPGRQEEGRQRQRARTGGRCQVRPPTSDLHLAGSHPDIHSSGCPREPSMLKLWLKRSNTIEADYHLVLASKGESLSSMFPLWAGLVSMLLSPASIIIIIRQDRMRLYSRGLNITQ